MASRANPAVIGGFVLGAIALAIAGLVVVGGGKFFQHRQFWEANFDESIKGLAIGAPVTFCGVKVGSVTDIRVVVNRNVSPDKVTTDVMRTPVFFEISADRIADTAGNEVRFEKDAAGVKRLIEFGLRAQLELQSLVTGQLGINLDFHPGAPMKLTGVSLKYPEFPTVPSTMAALGRSLDDLNLNEVAQDIRQTVKGIERLVNSPEVKKIFVSANATLARVDTLAANADSKIAKLGPALEKATATLNETLDTIRVLTQNVNSQTVPAVSQTLQDVGQLARRIESETVPGANQFLGDASQVAKRLDAETVPAVNQLVGQVRQLAASFERTSDSVRLAVEQIRQLATTADAAVQDRQPLLYQINTSL
ncbi:MAG: Mammalian cell entry related domain protein, partial [candidate division NC10 bacterium]|nr:Mammalian cell entry related domain protein [candidate division NC10 bacterium]